MSFNNTTTNLKSEIRKNYKDLAKAVINRAIIDASGRNKDGGSHSNLYAHAAETKKDAQEFLKHFDGSLYDEIIKPSAEEREVIRKAAGV